MRYLPLLIAGSLAACQTTTDPSQGGFVAGVSGISSGAYQARVDNAEADVAQAQARNAELRAQINASESELAQLKLNILNQRNQIGTTDRATTARIDRVLADQPTGANDQARLAALRRSIAEARALSADLAKLSG